MQHQGGVQDVKGLAIWIDELPTLKVLSLGNPQENVPHSFPSTLWASGDAILSHRITQLPCQLASPLKQSEVVQHRMSHRDKDSTTHSRRVISKCRT